MQNYCFSFILFFFLKKFITILILEIKRKKEKIQNNETYFKFICFNIGISIMFKLKNKRN